MSKLLLLIFASTLVAGCATNSSISTPPYYPSNPSAVLLEHQGQVQAVTTASSGGETVTASYALMQHLGLLASGSLALHSSTSLNGNQYSGEIGAGCFDTMATKHVYSELYGGVGWGSATANVDSYNVPFDTWPYQEISGKENRNFGDGWLQAAAGYVKGNFSMMMILRAEYVDLYRDITNGMVITHSYNITSSTAPYDTTYSSRISFWMLTPALEARYGLDHIQLIANVFGSHTSGANGQNSPLMYSLGLCYRF